MKKLLLLWTVLLCAATNAQVKLSPEILAAKKVSVDNFENKEEWIEWEDTYTMRFEQSPEGIKHLFEIIEPLLKKNNHLFTKPTVDESIIESFVTRITEFHRLNASILIGDTVLRRIWGTGGKSYILINLTQDVYEIDVTKK
jgi:hypothetical protein